MKKELDLQDPEEADDQEELEIELENKGKKKPSLVDAILKGRHNDIHIHLGSYSESA